MGHVWGGPYKASKFIDSTSAQLLAHLVQCSTEYRGYYYFDGQCRTCVSMNRNPQKLPFHCILATTHTHPAADTMYDGLFAKLGLTHTGNIRNGGERRHREIERKRRELPNGDMRGGRRGLPKVEMEMFSEREREERERERERESLSGVSRIVPPKVSFSSKQLTRGRAANAIPAETSKRQIRLSLFPS